MAALENPNRVFVDLPEVKVVLPDPLGDTPAGLIKGFRHGMSAPGKSRVVIDVTGPVVVEKYSIEKPADGKFARIVIDLVSADEATVTEEARAAMRAGALGLGAVSLQPPTPKPAQSPQARAANAFKPVIVIDPGHGGEDGGATKFGTLEKNVVLSFSLKLREKLNETGRYKVLMTRETDVFVPLEERREFAERNQAALFIAIHADYAARATARGATIYSLRPQLSEFAAPGRQRPQGERALQPGERPDQEGRGRRQRGARHAGRSRAARCRSQAASAPTCWCSRC